MKKLISFSALILSLCAFAIFAYAAEPAKEGAQAPSVADARQSNQGADIVLLIDSSGSMKKTDPRNYRKDSARLFISLLSADDNVAVFSFGDSAKSLIPLTPNTKKNQASLFNAVNKISSKEMTTDITGAVKQGFEELRSSTRKNKILLLMSDGKLDLGDPRKEEASLDELMKLLPELKKAGIKIYTIAFSELSDPKLLGDLADKTGGFFRYAATDKDIHIMFASIFEKIKSPDSVALEGDSFNIDKDVKEAVLLVTKKAGTTTMLMDPSGKKSVRSKSAKNIQWFGSDVFDMITVQDPEPGKWKIRLSSKEGNKIFVLTNLKLRNTAIQNSINKGDKVIVNAWLEKDDKRIMDKEVLGQVTFSAEVTGPDGKGRKIALAEKPAPDEGIYFGDFAADQPGDYSLKLIAESKTFNRTKDLLFKAVEPPPPAVAPAAQPVPPPSAAAGSEIDWQIVSFVLAGMVLMLIVLSAAFYIRSRKYKKFYVQGFSELPESAEAAKSDAASETKEIQEMQPDVEISIPHIGEEAPAASETENQSARINKLLGIIDFQKKKIAELMLIKDVIENARLRLSTFPIKNREVQDKVKKIAESYGVKDEFNEPLGSLEDDASELVSYILVLEREEARLTEKFERWEEELKRLLENEELVPIAESAGEGSSARVSELENKLSEVESQLMSKDRKLKSLEQQYEDIEKEYMILYQQQQKQQQEQPNI